jgi:hypothetical protein
MGIRGYERRSICPTFEHLEPRETPSGNPWITENFDSTAVGQLPAKWVQWSSNTSTAAAVSAARSFSAPGSLAVTANLSTLSARAWSTTVVPADLESSADVYLNSLIPAQVFVRGQNLDTAQPSFYAVGVTRGLTLELDRVAGGVITVLGSVTSKQYTNNLWVQVTIAVVGQTLKAQIVRTDTNQFLSNTGDWQTAPAWALSVSDTTLPSAGLTGVSRPRSYTGTIYFDHFVATSADGDTIPPTVQFSSPSNTRTLTGVVPVTVNASDNVGVVRVEYYVDGALRNVSTTAPYLWSFDTASASNGVHLLTAKAYDLAGNVGQAFLGVVTQNAAAVPLPVIPQHYSWIRIAELAYAGTPLTSVEQTLLKNSVDLLVVEGMNLSRIQPLAPNTPQILYTNLSNVYGDELTDLLAYEDALGLLRESAFYHVTTLTPFSGNSPSSQPVNWFWNVQRGNTSFNNLTSQAHGGYASGVPFGAPGESLYIASPDKFREININLQTPAGAGWAGQWEYASSVNANGRPANWKALPLLSDTTQGMHQSGTVTFDPPADWLAASINVSVRLFYVRLRTTSSGSVPVAQSILGRDYVNAHGTTAGIIPVFDLSADVNHDGYLNDAEYAHRKPGDDARFLYESRLFFGNYGQMRFAINPAVPGVKNWAADFAKRLLAANPAAAGLFLDNSLGDLPGGSGITQESSVGYAADYASLVNVVAQAIAPHWVLANTAGGGNVDTLIPKAQGYYEEFAIRALAQNYSRFEDLATLVSYRVALRSPSGYAVLDSLPAGGSPTDPRTQLATLAAYYLIANPNRTFLDIFGGFEPSTSWTRHWIPAAAYNVGQPTSTWSLFASGADPSNTSLTYHVYQRTFANALVLYKPLSYGHNVNGTLAANTATTHSLGGTYRPLNADGTLGAPVTTISLRNGEGAILIKA